MARSSFVRELFSGRFDGLEEAPYPLLGSGRFQQLEPLFGRMRHYEGSFERADAVLSSLGLLDPSRARYLPAAARLVQQLAALDPSSAVSLVAHEALGLRAVERFGTDAQIARLHAKDAGLCAFGLTEASPGSDVSQVQTYAEPLPNGHYRIEGAKSWVTNAIFASHFVVIARTVPPYAGDKPRLTAFLVERAQGVEVTKVESEALVGAGVGEVTLQGVEVPPTAVIGEVGKGFRLVMSALSEARLYVGAAVLGVCIQAVNDTIERLRQRRAFGRSVGQFPSVRERVSRMLSECLAAESLVYLCANLAEKTGATDAVESAVVRLAVARTASRVLDAARELHGAAAFVSASGAVRKWADGRALCLLDGSDFALESFVTLEGTRVARQRAERLAEAMQNPLSRLDVFGEVAIDSVRRRIDRMAPGTEPALARISVGLKRRADELGRAVLSQIRRYGRDIIEMQHVQRRLAVAVTDLSIWASLLVRTEREHKDSGEIGSRRMIELAQIWTNSADARIARAFAELASNDDLLRDRVATRGYTDGGYPFDVF
jgi:alkylation response protein AidB-like acyl-CoA dehydrogenase